MNGSIPKKFTIDRSKWRCGGDSSVTMRGVGDTELLNPEGFMCCLGQVSKQCGVSDGELLERLTPRVLAHESAKKVSPFLVEIKKLKRYEEGDEDPLWHKRATALCETAMNINDDMSRSDEEREKDLTNLFAANGYELEFVGAFAR